MLKVIGSLFVLLFSGAALVYWARYTCLSIMRAGSAREQAERVAEANRLEFQKIRQRLENERDPNSYQRFSDALRHDFLALTYLLRYAATIEVGRYSREERLLIIDFYAMRLLFRFARTLWPDGARQALLEMSGILEYFASVMNRRMLAFSASMTGP